MVLNGKRQSDLVRICQELIRRPSPSGKEREVATFIADTMRSIGYDEVSIDLYGNVIGRQFFATPGKRLLLESQMDHIDPGTLTDWSYYPYGAFIKDGCIYGRGASDQKGCLAAMILAGAELKNNFYNKLKGELVVAGTVFQERFEGVASRTVASAFPPDFVVLGEATELKIKRGQRGRAEIVIETQGRMTHL
jgi:acetylornithine deacetylase/succinyl-diaminopimelate desuccinylase-like protein